MRWEASDNVEDDIHVVAAEQFIAPDGYVDRENAARFFEEAHVLVAGWFLYAPEQFPPRSNVDPFYAAVHLTTNTLLTAPVVAHFQAYGPVGCSDLQTQQWLEEAGVPTFYSHCIAVTFPPYAGPRDAGTVVVDVDEAAVPSEIRRGATFLSHSWAATNRPRARLDTARLHLDLIKRADLLITSGLQSAVAALAYGTPVVFVSDNPTDAGLEPLARFISLQSVSGPVNWTPQTADVAPYRQALINAINARTALWECGQYNSLSQSSGIDD